MNMTQEMLEILIGKYLDGEITPSEQQILQKKLDNDPHAKELLEQFQALNERSCEIVATQIIGRGKEAEEIFEQAWQRRAANPFHRILKMDGRLRFAVGLAAGLAIGIMLHFVLPFVSTPQSPPAPANILAQNTDNQMEAEQFAIPEPKTDSAENTLRNVDWYSFTDKQGNQWLIEGLRENNVTPAAYYGEL
jgi:anti-sigma factor RsiW